MHTTRKQVILNVLTYVTQAVLVFAITWLLSRYMGATQRGHWVLFTTSLQLMQWILSFAFAQTLQYHLSHNLVLDNKLLTLSFINSIWVTFFSYFVLFILYFTGYSHLIFDESFSSIYYKIGFGLFLFNVNSATILNAYFNAKGKFSIANWLTIASNIITFIALLISFYFYPSRNFHVVFITMLPVSTGIMLSQWVMAYNITSKKIWQWVSKQEWLQIWNYSRFAFSVIVLQALLSRIDYWFVKSGCGIDYVGVYSLSASFVQMLWLIPSAIASVLVIHFAKEDDAIAIPSLVKYMRWSFYIVLLGSLITVATLFIFCKPLFGIDFLQLPYIFLATIIGTCLFSNYWILAAFYSCRNLQIFNTKALSLGLLILILGNIILIPLWHIWGVCLANTLALSISSFWMLYNFHKKYQCGIAVFFCIQNSDFVFVKNLISNLKNYKI